MSRRGLPPDLKLATRLHYVESLIEESNQPVIRMVPIDRILPNPWQPRQDFGDLEELAESIRIHGLLEPILVRTREDGFQLVAGERRLRACRMAGLKSVPCIESNVNDEQMLEIALIENLQRKDLDPFEESDAYQQLIDRFNYTHAELAKVLNKSRSTISEILALRNIPETIRDLCRQRGILSRKELLTLSRQPDTLAMRLCIEAMSSPVTGSPPITKDSTEPLHNPKSRAKSRSAFVFRDPFGEFEVRVRFYQGSQNSQFIRKALMKALESLKNVDE